MSMSSFSTTTLAMILLFIALFLMLYLAVSEDREDQVQAGTEFQDPFAVGLNPDRDYLILVNGRHKYNFGGEYDKALQPDLIYVSNADGDPARIEKGANLAFSLLKQRLRDKEDIEVELFSGYRTEEDQEWLLDLYGDFEGTGSPASKRLARPGCSEHHTGLLLQIKVRQRFKDRQFWITELPKSEEPTYKTIRKNLADFGFIERYPAYKESITGIEGRPLEIRFVGSSKVAHEIMDNDLCLEEYLEQKGE